MRLGLKPRCRKTSQRSIHADPSGRQWVSWPQTGENRRLVGGRKPLHRLGSNHSSHQYYRVNATLCVWQSPQNRNYVLLYLITNTDRLNRDCARLALSRITPVVRQPPTFLLRHSGNWMDDMARPIARHVHLFSGYFIAIGRLNLDR